MEDDGLLISGSEAKSKLMNELGNTINSGDYLKINTNIPCDVFCRKTDRDIGNARWKIWTQSERINKLPPTSQGRFLVQDIPDPCMAW